MIGNKIDLICGFLLNSTVEMNDWISSVIRLCVLLSILNNDNLVEGICCPMLIDTVY